MQIAAAEMLPVARLATLFNEGYRGYDIPIEFDAAAMRRHLAYNDIDLTLSRVAVDGTPAALALIGRRGPEAWVGGMGTVPDHRRRGLGERTLHAALGAAAGAGVSKARLEVLVSNAKAVALYEKLGFVTTRRLLVYTLNRLPQPRHAHPQIGVDAALAWIAGRQGAQEPWQRARASLAHMQAAGQRLGAAAVDRDGQRIAAVIWAEDESAVRVLQVAADDAKAAREALLAVSAAARGRPVRAANFPEDGEVARAIARFGIDPELAQFEMELPFARLTS